MLGFEALAIVRGAAVLPHDGVVDGLARGGIPNDGGLALVGDPEGTNFMRLDLGLF